jgi:hypothetical protein
VWALPIECSSFQDSAVRLDAEVIRIQYRARIVKQILVKRYCPENHSLDFNVGREGEGAHAGISSFL